MTKFNSFLLIGLCYFAIFLQGSPTVAQTEFQAHQVMLGDSWYALALRFGTTSGELQSANPHPNRFREPVIGRTISLPTPTSPEQTGRLIIDDRSLFQLSADSGVPAWQLALLNDIAHPAGIKFASPIFLPGAETLRQYPAGFNQLELSHPLGRAGEAMGFRGGASVALISGYSAIGSEDGNLHVATVANGQTAIGLLATGAFFRVGAPPLDIVTTLRSQKAECLTPSAQNEPSCLNNYLWSQPWQFERKQWNFDNITLTGTAAAIDQESIAAERARLFTIWEQQSADYLPTSHFEEPVSGYLYHSSYYGARRSYNGGPYSSYHEGLDFAAYRGSNVTAPAAGVIVLAETLYVRGGAVIIDHGLGVYTGLYHLDSVDVTLGDTVQQGDLVGKVGSTGLSTGPHLHWDLLVNGVWIDPFTWRESATDCWLAEALGQPCDAKADG